MQSEMFSLTIPLLNWYEMKLISFDSLLPLVNVLYIPINDLLKCLWLN